MSHHLPVILKVILLERREAHTSHTQKLQTGRSDCCAWPFSHISLRQEMLQEAGLFSFGAALGWLFYGFHWMNIRVAFAERNEAQKAVRGTSRKSKGRMIPS